MNSLNSVLLEGTVRDVQMDDGRCTFKVLSDRFYRQDDVIEKEVCTFSAEAFGRLAQSCHDNLQPGRGVRIVGRLRTVRQDGEELVAVDGDGHEYMPVVIVAEHVEFKPAFNKEPQA